MIRSRKRLFSIVLSYVGLALLLALPTLGAPLSVPDAGTGETTLIYAMNTGGPQKNTRANLVVEFVDSAGGTAGDVSKVIYPMGHALAGSWDITDSQWIGSAVMYSDVELAAIGRLRWTGGSASDGITQGSFAGFSSGSTKVYLPNLFRRPWMYSTIAVQNLGDDAAYFQMEYYSRQATTPFDVQTSYGVPAGAHRYYDLMYPYRSTHASKIPSFPSEDWAGSVIITSDNDIAAVVSTHQYEYAGIYEGIGLEEADSTVYLPSVFKRKFNNWYSYTGILIQNTEPVHAGIRLKLYGWDGNLAKEIVRVLPPLASYGINTRYWGDEPGEDLYDLGFDWVGSAVVQSSTKVAVQVNTDWPGQRSGASYNGIPLSGGTPEVFLPYVGRYPYGAGNWLEFCGVLIQNLSDQTNVVDFYVYPAQGTSNWATDYQLHGALTLDPWSIRSFNTRYSAGFDALGTGWHGTALLSAQHNIGAVVNCQRWDSAFTYNGINQ